MDPNEKVFKLLEDTDLYWTVSKLPLVSESGLKTQSFGIFRNDTNAWLGTVGERYEMLQNWEMAQVLVLAAENIGMTASRGGSLHGGRLVFLQIELPKLYIGKSDVKRWITPLNSHDGSTSFAFGSTNVTVICANTWRKAYGEMQKFRHTASLKERVSIAQKNLELTLKNDEALVNNLKVMADTRIHNDALDRVWRTIFDVKKEKEKDISTKKLNQIESFLKSVELSIKEQGDSLWALFNGVTRYTNHISAPTEGRDEYLMTGSGNTISEVGFKEIMRFVEENTERQGMTVAI